MKTRFIKNLKNYVSQNETFFSSQLETLKLNKYDLSHLETYQNETLCEIVSILFPELDVSKMELEAMSHYVTYYIEN